LENELILALTSLVVLAMGLLYLERVNRLSVTGKKAAAIIISNNYKIYGNDRPDIYYPVVRFQTLNNNWVTQELSFGTNPPKAEGSTINILYNPANPQEVQINSGMHLTFLPRLLTIAGACGVALTCLELLEFTNII